MLLRYFLLLIWTLPKQTSFFKNNGTFGNRKHTSYQTPPAIMEVTRIGPTLRIPTLELIKCSLNHMDHKTAKLIYQSMIVAILTYCPLALYGSIPPYLKQKINSLESRAQAIIGVLASGDVLVGVQVTYMIIDDCDNLCGH